jgi:hypothetical protein
MTILDIAQLGYAAPAETTGAPVAQAAREVTGPDDLEQFGDVPMMQALGVSSLPYGPTSEGWAEGVIAEGVAGRPAVCVGGWDTRTARIVGNMKPGDTVVHSTGPSQAAQLQLKEEKRQAVLVSKDSDGTQMILVLDGKNDKFQIAARGAAIQIDKDGVIALSSRNGAHSIVLSDDGIQLLGKVHLGGTPAAGVAVMLGPVTGSPGGAASTPMVASKSVTIGG